MQVTVSFLAVEFTMSHSRDQTSVLFYKRAFIWEVKHVSDKSVILSIYSSVKIGSYKQIGRSEEYVRSPEFQRKVRSEIFPTKANFFANVFTLF